jgi:transposase
LGCASKKTIYATEQDRPDVALARRLWTADQVSLDFTRLVFIDETGTTTRMVRTHGWGRKGQRLIGRAPHGHWMTQTFIAGLAHDGIIAPMVLPCPMTGAIFRQWLDEWLIPEMQPGSIVVLDNLAAHKVAGVRQQLEAAGMGLLYLPPYSPDLNPIELAFAKIKRALRRMAPRSFDAICDALGDILDTFSPTECANYLRHAGYVQS